MTDYIQLINEFKISQNNKCELCKCELEKPYPDVDWEEGIFYALLCLDCYDLSYKCDYDPLFLVEIRKYFKLRDKIYKDMMSSRDTKKIKS